MISLVTFEAKQDELFVGSSIGASSTTSAPTKFFLLRILRIFMKPWKSSPPASGVPVPGKKPGSKKSRSSVR
jgi:hypothetical protein